MFNLQEKQEFSIERGDIEWEGETLKTDPAKMVTTLFTDPPPGITAIDVELVRVEGDMAYVTMTTEDFIRNNVEFGHDPYWIAELIRKDLGEEAAKAAIDFMKDPSNGFKIAMLDTTDGKLDADQYPLDLNDQM